MESFGHVRIIFFKMNFFLLSSLKFHFLIKKLDLQLIEAEIFEQYKKLVKILVFNKEI